MTADVLNVGREDTSRTMATISYALLISSVFFAGAPALVAVVIAYSHLKDAAPAIRRHYDFQIKIFWVAFVLTLCAGTCALGAAITGMGQLVSVAALDGLEHWRSVSIDVSHFALGTKFLGLAIAALVLAFLSSVWLLVAPTIGLLRLANEQSIGHSPRP